MPRLSAAGLTARASDPARYAPEQAAAAALQDELIAGFLGASAYPFEAVLSHKT